MIQLPFVRRSKLKALAAAAEQTIDDLARYNTSQQQRLRSANAEIEHCRRDHTELAGRTSKLQTANVQLAHRAEHAEHQALAAALQADHMGGLAATYWQQLLDHRITPLGPRPAGERT